MQIFDIIDRIRPRPGLYLGELSITKLNAFLDGYNTALYDLGTAKDSDNTLLPLPFHCFHDYVALRLGYYESTSGWRNMILDQTNRDETQGLALFFTLLDDFRALESKQFFAAELTDQNKAHHIHDKFAPRLQTGPNYEHSQPLYHNPLRIYYAELADPSGFVCYVGIVQTDTRFIIGRTLNKDKAIVLSFYESCFGTVAWQPLDQNPFKE